MADFNARTITMQTRVCELPLPTNAVELSKMLRFARDEYAGHYDLARDEVPDDALAVTSIDGEVIVVSWEVR